MFEKITETRLARNGAIAPLLPNRRGLPANAFLIDMFAIAGFGMLGLLMLGNWYLRVVISLFSWVMPGFWFLIRVMPFLPRLCRYELRHDIVLAGVDNYAFLEVNLMPHIKGAIWVIIVASAFQLLGLLMQLSQIGDFGMTLFACFLYFLWVVSLISIAIMICLNTIKQLCRPRPASLAFCWIRGFGEMLIGIIGLMCVTAIIGFIDVFFTFIAYLFLAFLLFTWMKKQIEPTADKYGLFE